MKFLTGFCLLIASISFISGCKKDDENFAGNLPGVWEMTDIHTDNGVLTSSALGQTLTSTLTFHGKNYNTRTTFTENPNEFSSEGSYTAVTSITYLGQVNTTESNVDAFAGTGTWSINGSTLTQVFGGETTEVEILELNNNTLRLKLEQNTSTNNNGIINTSSATIFSTFQRIN